MTEHRVNRNGDAFVSTALLAESLKIAQQADQMISIEGDPRGFKPGELQVFMASRQTGKTRWQGGVDFALGLEPLPLEGLTDAEQGPQA